MIALVPADTWTKAKPPKRNFARQVMSQLYRKARTQNLLLPVQARKAQEGDKYEGATVIEPVKGFYQVTERRLLYF